MAISTEFDFLVVGGGIGGLATAIALKQQGFTCHVFEKTPGLSELGAGIWLPPNALAVIRHLGLEESIQKHGNIVDHITVTSSTSGKIQDLNLRKFEPEFNWSILAIHRYVLQSFLAQQILSSDISFSFNIKSIEQQENSVTLTDSLNKKYTGRFLIGADGLRSMVRPHVTKNAELRYSGYSSFRAITSAKCANIPSNASFELWGLGCRFGASSLIGDQLYWYLTFYAPANQKIQQHERKDFARHFFDKGLTPILPIIESTSADDIIETPIFDLSPIQNWVSGRIGLIGDAAHATTPNLGQGAAQAIEDALALALSFKKFGLDPTALAAYQKIRIAKAQFVVNRSWSYGKMVHAKSKPLRILRDLVLRSAPGSMTKTAMKYLYTPIIE